MTIDSKVKLNVVDADGHYIEPADLTPYMEERYRADAPRRVSTPGGGEGWGGRNWISEGAPTFGNVVFDREGDEAKQGLMIVSDDKPMPAQHTADAMRYNELSPGIMDSHGRLKVMDEEGFDASVLYPTAGLAWIPDSDFHQAVNRALNDWLAEWCSADPKRLLGATNIVAIHDVEAACAEVRRCHDQHGFKAIFLRTCLPNKNVRWWDRQYDPFWATCEELGVAVGFHPFPGDTMEGAAKHFDIIGPEPELLYMRTPFNIVVDAMHALIGVITGGVCERFPGLHLAILESSGGWLVPFLERLDSRFEYMGHTLPQLKMKPSDYFRRQWWISFDPEEAMLRPTAEWLGADRIIWGSDYPHPDAFYPGFVDMLNKNVASLSQTDQDGIRGLNAIEFYRL